MDDAPLDVKGRMDVLMVGVRFFLDQPSVDDLLANIEHAHTVMPFMDPTAYMRGTDNLRWQTDVLRAVKAFQTALEPIRELRESTASLPGGG